MQLRQFRHACLALAVLASVAAWERAYAEDSLRCGSHLISTGDSKDKVRSLCGQPTNVSPAGVIRAGGYAYGPYDYSYFGPAWVEIPVEIWTYNFGSTKLLRKLRFHGDELVEVRTEGYGY